MNRQKWVSTIKKLFGTDGIRGLANQDLTADLAYRLGRATGHLLIEDRQLTVATGGQKEKSPSNSDRVRVLIGQDTRLSSQMLEDALAAGFMSVGVDVVKLGVIPTPGVAYLISHYQAQAGAMISASHNPYYDNGIKIFDHMGYKVSEDVEVKIESYLLDDEAYAEIPYPSHDGLGRRELDSHGLELYADHLKSTLDVSLAGLSIILDCANGAASQLAPEIFRDLGAQVKVIHASPNGININEACGSTNIESLRQALLADQADIGFAFDGDADRLIAIDHTGATIDGDYILTICGLDMLESGQLQDRTIVTTVMANMGLFAMARDHEIDLVQTAVGDKYVLELMLAHGYKLGGEQSGHIIFADYAKTGDGILTALQLVKIVVTSKKTLAELGQPMIKYPQLLINVPVQDRAKFASNQVIKEAIAREEVLLADQGRILVRPSGTENLVRVMAEAKDQDLLTEVVNRLVDLVKAELA